MTTQLILFTASFPFGSGEEFLETELQFARSHFGRVVVVPLSTAGPERQVPTDIEVSKGFSDFMGRRRSLRLPYALRSLALREVRAEVRCQFRTTRPFGKLKLLLAYSGHALLTRDYLREFLPSAHFTIVYSYWLGFQTLGAIMARNDTTRVVSRVHGGDLYEEVNRFGYLPFRRLMLKEIDSLFPVSLHGHRYLCERYAGPKRMTPMYLGVVGPTNLTTRNLADDIRIVSCCRLKPVKRIELIAYAIAEFARRNPSKKVTWDQLGGGPLERRVTRLARSIFPNNATMSAHGDMSNEDVLSFYGETQPDLFMNLSVSEGIPVSMMEAQSFGIPIVATAVGGVPEIVNESNGALLSESPALDEIVDSMESILLDQRVHDLKGKSSRMSWQQKFNAHGNYRRFYRSLAELAQEA